MKYYLIIYCLMLVELMMVNYIQGHLFCYNGTDSYYTSKLCNSFCAKSGCSDNSNSYTCDIPGVQNTNGSNNKTCENGCCSKITACTKDFCNPPSLSNISKPISCYIGNDFSNQIRKCTTFCLINEVYNCSLSNSVKYRCGNNSVTWSACGFQSICCNNYTVCNTDFCNKPLSGSALSTTIFSTSTSTLTETPTSTSTDTFPSTSTEASTSTLESSLETSKSTSTYTAASSPTEKPISTETSHTTSTETSPSTSTYTSTSTSASTETFKSTSKPITTSTTMRFTTTSLSTTTVLTSKVSSQSSTMKNTITTGTVSTGANSAASLYFSETLKCILLLIGMIACL